LGSGNRQADLLNCFNEKIGCGLTGFISPRGGRRMHRLRCQVKDISPFVQIGKKPNKGRKSSFYDFPVGILPDNLASSKLEMIDATNFDPFTSRGGSCEKPL